MTNPTIKPDLSPAYRPGNMPDFKIGDEVQIRISGECDFKCPECGKGMHGWIEQGSIGTIESVSNWSVDGLVCRNSLKYNLPGCGASVRSQEIKTHHYAVSIENLPGGWFCALELTLRETGEARA